MTRIFSILLFITRVYYLETSKKEEMGESEEETDVEIETTSETKGTKQEQEESHGNQENSKLEIFQDKKDKEIFWFEKPL
ncbi:hypothetical protein I3843_10G050100, partial [Carya illinoinensis]